MGQMVLVVDTDEGMCRELADGLDAARFQVVWTTDAQAAEGLLQQREFDLVLAEDVTSGEVEVSRRWHDARERRASELIRLEGDETFAGLQRFLSTVHRLTGEGRMSRFVYLAGKV